MPVNLLDLTDLQMADYAWTENHRRQDLTCLDRALSIQKRIDQFGWSLEQAATHMGMSRPAVSNSLRLLELPPEIQTAIQDGKISERSASALMSLFNLPEEVRRAVEERYQVEVQPSSIVKDALAGQSSERLRERVDLLAKRMGTDMSDAEFPLDRPFDAENIHSPTCKSCDARITHNKIPYCLLDRCYRNKTNAYHQEYLQRASLASGISPLESELHNSYRTTDFHHYPGELAAVRAAGCENLRLKYESYISSYNKSSTLTDQGFEHAEIVCKKQRQFCSCLNGLEAARKNPDAAAQIVIDRLAVPTPNDTTPVISTGEEPAPVVPTAGDLKEIARRANTERRTGMKQIGAAKKVAEVIIARALAENDLGAWRLLLNRVTWNQPKEVETVDELRGELAHRIVEKDLAPWEPKSLEYVISTINGRLKAVGLSLIVLDDNGVPIVEPDRVPVFRRRFERIVGWVNAINQDTPAEAIRGNLANLNKLELELHDDGLQDDPRLVELPARLAALRDKLAAFDVER